MNSLDESSLEGKDRTLFQNMKSILSKRSKSLIPSQAKLASSVGRREQLLSEMREMRAQSELKSKLRGDLHDDSRIFLGIPQSSLSRSACNLEELPGSGGGMGAGVGQVSPAGSSLRYLSPRMSSSSSDSEDDHCNDYVYQLQLELERLRKEKLKLVKSNCEANRKLGELRRQRHSLSRHLNTVKKQVNLLQMGRSTSLDGSELQSTNKTGIFMKDDEDIILLTNSKRRYSHTPVSGAAQRRVRQVDIEKMNIMLEEKTGILNTSFKRVKEKRHSENMGNILEQSPPIPSQGRDSPLNIRKGRRRSSLATCSCSNISKGKCSCTGNSNPSLPQTIKEKQCQSLSNNQWYRPKSSNDLFGASPKKEVRILSPSSKRRGSSLELSPFKH